MKKLICALVLVSAFVGGCGHAPADSYVEAFGELATVHKVDALEFRLPEDWVVSAEDESAFSEEITQYILMLVNPREDKKTRMFMVEHYAMEINMPMQMEKGVYNLENIGRGYEQRMGDRMDRVETIGLYRGEGCMLGWFQASQSTGEKFVENYLHLTHESGVYHIALIIPTGDRRVDDAFCQAVIDSFLLDGETLSLKAA